MREIKFRAWDKENKKFFTPTHQAYRDELESLMVNFSGDLSMHRIDGLHHESTFPDRFMLQQFTGLRDRHGKEVYEGDIIQTDDDTMEVRWIGDLGGLHRYSFVGVSHEGPTNDTIHTLPAIGSEVIGNIYENPELLTNSNPSGSEVAPNQPHTHK